METEFNSRETDSTLDASRELILKALVNELACKITQHLKDNDFTPNAFSIKIKGEPCGEPEKFTFSNIDLTFNFSEEQKNSSLILNAIEFTQYSSFNLSTVIGTVINVHWIAYNHSEFLGDGIAKYYDPDSEENSAPIS